MLELTGKDIGQLNDTDLRTLIGLLCEAELRQKNLPRVGVTWGGHQDAPDGGIDVRVHIDNNNLINGFIPKSQTGFQVKKPNMSSEKEILKEMSPNGELRKVIKELAKNKGAYIIISGNATTTDSSLSARKSHMRTALKEFKYGDDLITDFYSQGRVASWVRDHPSLIFWVREKIGNPIQGWQPYRNWSKHNEDTSELYFTDENVRIFEGLSIKEKGLSIVEGVNLLRERLRNTSKSVRLAGLSGVGKTRLLQALFDNRIGKNSLNESRVVYADMNNLPNPQPHTFAKQLLALNQPIILAIDNCRPDLHIQLNKICTVPESKINLVTIEYDIKDGDFNTTDTFKLEPISNILIEKITQNQFPNIGQKNAIKIADFSGGNARIAFALARTVQKGESIDYLKDNELFERLFLQRNTPSKSLMQSAEICALIYSFNIEMESGKDSEMAFLASLTGKNQLDLYRDIITLEKRELIQKRNIWRAVLPHAIANRLATRALENIPSIILTNLFKDGSDRLLKSFAHRLSYLHKSIGGQEVATRWLSENELLGNLNELNDTTLDVFKKIALLSPIKTLAALERAAESGIKNENAFKQIQILNEFALITSVLAYDSKLFERCLNLLIIFHKLDVSDQDKQNIRIIIETLFFARNSRTEAPLELRINVVKKLIYSGLAVEVSLGYSLLKSLLKTRNFKQANEFLYYQRKYNDYGYSPINQEDINKWYTTTLNLCEEIITDTNTEEEQLYSILSENYGHLWLIASHYGFNEKLESLIQLITKNGAWITGWLEIRKILRYNKNELTNEQITKLQKLERKLAPTSIQDQVKAYVLSNDSNSYLLLEKGKSDWKLLDTRAKELGKEISQNEEIFSLLLPELVRGNLNFNKRIEYFGESLALNCNAPLQMWDKIKAGYIPTTQNHSNRFLCGYLLGLFKRDSILSDKILDNALKDDFLLSIFPILQNSLENDGKRWDRMKKSIEIGRTPIWAYRSLSYTNLNKEYDKFIDVLSLLLQKEGGMDITIEFLWMVFDNLNNNKANAQIKSFARSVLTKVDFNRNQNSIQNLDLKLGKIIDGCFDEVSDEGKMLCDNIVNADKQHKIYLTSLLEILQSLAKTQPTVFLDSFLNDDEPVLENYNWHFNEDKNPLMLIDDMLIIDWCEQKPLSRYAILATSINLFTVNTDTNQLELSTIAYQILEKAPNISIILAHFSNSFTPSSWSGSLANILEKRLSILETLKLNHNETISTWAVNQVALFKKKISERKEEEELRIRCRNERFE